MAILVIAEHDHHHVSAATLSAITAARGLGGPVHVLVAGGDCESVARDVATIRGVAKVKVAESPGYASLLAEDIAALILSSLADVTHIVAGATTFAKGILPRVAASLDVAQISDVVSITGPDLFIRPIYDGNALATVKSTDRQRVLSIRPSAFEPSPRIGGTAPIEGIDAQSCTGRARLVSRQPSASVRPELRNAKAIVSGGRGLGSKERFEALLLPLADQLGAAIGASRAAVDAGFISSEHQVGSTGKIVAPELYIAVGISGAVQHLAGMLEAKTIVAINNDPDAPIFQLADYGLVADADEALPQLTSEIARSVAATGG